MIMFYSSSTGLFYSLELCGANMPSDATELDYETYQALMEGQNEGKIIDFSTSPPRLKEWEVVWPTAKDLSAKLDAHAAEVYANWARFESEYALREKAAQAFKDTGYKGDPGIWVRSFAQAAELNNQAAADRILEQAAALRQAQEDLGAVRMRKYELGGLEDEPRSALYTQLIAEIDAIAARVDEGGHGVAVL